MSTIADLPAGVEWLHEDTEEEFDDESTQCRARFWLPWSARQGFRAVVGGTPQTFTIGTVSYTRVIPLAYPFYDNVYAYKLHLKGEGASRLAADEKSIEYDWAIADVWFRTPPWRVTSPYPLVTVNMETNADMVTRPGTAYVFPSDGSRLASNVSVRVPCTEFTLTFHQVPTPNQALYTLLAGHVNATTFFGYAPGCCQYIGPATGGTLNSWGQTSWTMTHRFRFRWIEHNKIMRPDGAGFEAPVAVGTGEFLLPVGELNLLWAG